MKTSSRYGSGLVAEQRLQEARAARCAPSTLSITIASGHGSASATIDVDDASG